MCQELVLLLNSWCLHHNQKLSYDCYYLNILVYHQDYLFKCDYQLNNRVPYLEQRHIVGHVNSYNQMNSCRYVNSYIQMNSHHHVNSYIA